MGNGAFTKGWWRDYGEGGLREDRRITVTCLISTSPSVQGINAGPADSSTVKPPMFRIFPWYAGEVTRHLGMKRLAL